MILYRKFLLVPGLAIMLGSGEKGHPYVGKKGPLAVGKKRPKLVG